MNRRASLAALLPLALAGVGRTVVLYDASGLKTPSEAPWAWTLGGAGGVVTPPSAGSPFTRLDTTSNAAIQEGWLQISPFALNRTTGYDVTFDLRLTSEAHGSPDRAGLSVIVLSSDKRGIELSFWTNEVWAQNDSPLFTHGEGATWDTTAAGSGIGGLRRYRLHVAGNGYSLFADGAPLFSGSLRDYSAFSGFPDPYETPNFLWVGDDTSSAGANAAFGRFEVNAVPEPLSLSALGIGVAAVARRRRPSNSRAKA